jgi:REP element-mobilizing transposase RayT
VRDASQTRGRRAVGRRERATSIRWAIWSCFGPAGVLPLFSQPWLGSGFPLLPAAPGGEGQGEGGPSYRFDLDWADIVIRSPANVRPAQYARNMPIARQQTFEFRTWGGRRDGSGRKASRSRPAIPHRVREEFRPYQPIHVTLRMADWVWNLRSQRSFAIIHGALAQLRRRDDVRITRFSIQGNHIHLIVEAEGPRALANGIRALSIRLSRRLNAMMGRRGPVLEDRYTRTCCARRRRRGTRSDTSPGTSPATRRDAARRSRRRGSTRTRPRRRWRRGARRERSGPSR